MTSFADLSFKPHRRHPDGVHAECTFANGYGASVICTPYSYGGDIGLYELAVLRDGHLDYSTPITDNVLGWLTKGAVTRALRAIEALPAAAKVGA